MAVTTYAQATDDDPRTASTVLFMRGGNGGQATSSDGWVDSWSGAGTQGGGATPTTAAVLDNTTGSSVGPLPWTNPSSGAKYVAGGYMHTLCDNTKAVQDQQVMLVDRLAHMGGLSGTSVASQTVGVDVTGAGSNLANRRGATDYSDVLWWLVCWGQLGATPQNVTFSVTYNDGTSGSPVVAIPATLRQGSLLRIYSAANGKWIRSIASGQLAGSTGTAGNWGVMATRPLAYWTVPSYHRGQLITPDRFPITKVEDSACLSLLINHASTTAGNGVTAIGTFRLVEG